MQPWPLEEGKPCSPHPFASLHSIVKQKKEEVNIPVSMICVVKLIPMTTVSAPPVKTKSAASGSA